MEANDCIIVINAGSSSIKFSMFCGPTLEPALRGKAENLYSGVTRFIALDAGGQAIEEKRWPDAPLDHEAAMRFLVDFAQGHLDGYRLVAVGHRIVHGGVARSAWTPAFLWHWRH